jgi:hypothetical protein
VSGEAWFPEPFGPVYEMPPGAPCPDCGCCTLRLCQIAAGRDVRCSHLSGDPQTVAGCPCSATAAAPGLHLHGAGGRPVNGAGRIVAFALAMLTLTAISWLAPTGGASPGPHVTYFCPSGQHATGVAADGWPECAR